MEKIFTKRCSRGPNGGGRRARICSIRIPENVKLRIDKWKDAYERDCGCKISYENMLNWWMNNMENNMLYADADICRSVEADRRLNIFHSKEDVVKYLNRTGRFWEYCNNATSLLSDREVITKALLFLEFED